MGIQNQPTMERLPTPVSVGLGQLAVFKERHQFQFQQEPNFPSFFSFGFSRSPVFPSFSSFGSSRSPVARSSFRTWSQISVQVVRTRTRSCSVTFYGHGKLVQITSLISLISIFHAVICLHTEIAYWHDHGAASAWGLQLVSSLGVRDAVDQTDLGGMRGVTEEVKKSCYKYREITVSFEFLKMNLRCVCVCVCVFL